MFEFALGNKFAIRSHNRKDLLYHRRHIRFRKPFDYPLFGSFVEYIHEQTQAQKSYFMPISSSILYEKGGLVIK
jgi:hypothetical protein